MSQGYDIVQTAFLLNYAANGAAGISDTQANLLDYLQVYLNGGTNPAGNSYQGFFNLMNPLLLGSDWSVVWGPCVYSKNGNTPGYATNAMYAAYSPSQQTYVVAIAATNPDSITDWIAEDGDVAPEYQAEWPLTVPFERTVHVPYDWENTSAISAATAQGVSDLLTQSAMQSNGMTIQQFLANKANSADTLIFTGHSLAGALSPTLMLYLYPTSPGGWAKVVALPTAGASPGNVAFARLFNQTYTPVSSGVSGKNYGNWNTDYANDNDVVPHAWNQLGGVVGPADGDGNYPSYWGVLDNNIGGSISDSLTAAQTLAGLGYKNLTQQTFNQMPLHTWQWISNDNGSYQYPPTWVAMTVYTDAKPLSTDLELGEMILATHIEEYTNFFGVTPAPKMNVTPQLK